MLVDRLMSQNEGLTRSSFVSRGLADPFHVNSIPPKPKGRPRAEDILKKIEESERVLGISPTAAAANNS